MKGRHSIGNKPFGNIHLDYIKYKRKEKDIKQIYEKVKSEYLTNDNLDIDLERAYLNHRFIYNNGIKKRYYFNMLLIGVTAFFSIIFEKYLKSSIIDIITFAAIIFVIGKCILKIHTEVRYKKEEYEHKYYIICMKVLKEIENNKLNENELKNII